MSDVRPTLDRRFELSADVPHFERAQGEAHDVARRAHRQMEELQRQIDELVDMQDLMRALIRSKSDQIKLQRAERLEKASVKLAGNQAVRLSGLIIGVAVNRSDSAIRGIAAKSDRVPYVEREVDEVPVVPVSLVDARTYRNTGSHAEFYIADASTAHEHAKMRGFYEYRDELMRSGFQYASNRTRRPGDLVETNTPADEFALPMEMLLGFTFVNPEDMSSRGIRPPIDDERSFNGVFPSTSYPQAYAFLSDITMRDSEGQWVMV